VVEFYLKLKLILRIIIYLTYICSEIDNFVIKSDILRRFFICTKNILKKLSCYHDNNFGYFMFGKYNGFVSKARVSACMYFLVRYQSCRGYRLIVKEMHQRRKIEDSFVWHNYAKSGLFWTQCFLPSLVIRKARAGKSSLGLLWWARAPVTNDGERVVILTDLKNMADRHG
jgi:hypothetical protein